MKFVAKMIYIKLENQMQNISEPKHSKVYVLGMTIKRKEKKNCYLVGSTRYNF